MNCAEAQSLLSSYYDGQLRAPERDRVAEHVAQCGRCRDDLAAFDALSRAARRLPAPAPPPSIWESVARRLDQDRARPAGAPPPAARRRPLRPLLAAAAALLLAAGAFALVHLVRHGGHDPMAEEFQRYVALLERDPEAAQRRIVQIYNGRPVGPSDAAAQPRVAPIALRSPPPAGYERTGAYVLHMPCCNCVQTVLCRPDGGYVAVFEHDAPQPGWFGSRPKMCAQCAGKACELVGLGTQLAASCTVGERHVTIVGARSVEELSSLLAWLDEAAEANREGAGRRS